MAYTRRTDEELEVLAQDVVAGKVFHSSYHLPEGERLQVPFMMLALLDPEQLEVMRQDKIFSLYEYLDKAGPRSVNGLPCFFSWKALNDEDAHRIHERILAVESLLNSRKEAAAT